VEPLEAGLKNFVSSSIARFDRGEDFGYAIWNSDGSTLIGGAGLHPRLGPGRIQIGYWVRDGWLRRGVASVAARALAIAAFELPDVEEVHIHCDEANVASAGVPRRLGFRLLRTVEDEANAPAEVGRSMEWIITAKEWPSLR
jgi:RimJ/RimL family protein N-acetyltransferase